MKRKIIAGTLMTLFIVGALFTFLPVKAAPETIKIGLFGPMRMIQGVGILEGAQLAKEYIDTDPIMINGNPYTVELIPVDSALGNIAPEPTTGSGFGAMTWLLDQDPDFIVGGFRSEAVFGARDEAMDAHKIWFITGSATSHLIDCEGNLDPDGPLGPLPAKTCLEYGLGCNFDNYDKYRYIFRNTPPNVTCLLNSMAAFLQYNLMPKLATFYGEPGLEGKVRVAVISESAVWADVIWDYFTSPYVYPTLLGPLAYVDQSVSYRVAPDATDVTAELNAMDAAGVRLIIEVLSGDVGRTVETSWDSLGLNAVLFGINVVGQMSASWGLLPAGGVEYEAFLATVGFRNPFSTTSEPYTTTEFWDLYKDHTSTAVSGWDIFYLWPGEDVVGFHAPIYTSWGAYDSIIGIKETLETAGIEPPFDQAKSEALIPYFETADRDGLLGKFKYTSSHIVNLTDVEGPSFLVPVTKAEGVEYYRVAPFVEDGAYTVEDAWADAKAAYAATYDTGDVNPDMVGTLHDVYSPDVGPTWPQGYVRTIVGQWQAARIELVWPLDQAYTKKFRIPPWMYPLLTDLNYDGTTDIFDIVSAATAFGSYPGDLTWSFEADVNGDETIDIFDIVAIALDFGLMIDLPITTFPPEPHY